MLVSLNDINTLSVPTWNWLGVNSASLELESAIINGCAGNLRLSCPPGILVDEKAHHYATRDIAASVQVNHDFVWKNSNSVHTITIPTGTFTNEPILLEYSMDADHCFTADYTHIVAQKGSHATVIIYYTGQEAQDVFHSGFTLVEVEEGATVKLLKAQLLPADATHIDAVAVCCGENAFADVLLCELGGKNTYGACDIQLKGEKSSANIGGLYIGHGQDDIDLNYRIEFRGRETQGETSVRGALTGKAKKTLKSTIDFCTGAVGAQGSEEETVLALSDTAVNISAPLLLCGEENVEGRHATSTGNPDPAKIYYLMSRGLSKKQARQMLVEASFSPLIDKIDDEKIRLGITKAIGAIIYGEQV